MGFNSRFSQSSVTAEITGSQHINIPESGNKDYQYNIFIRNGRGILENPDDGMLFMRVLNDTGTAQDGILRDSGGSALTAAPSADSNFDGDSPDFWKEADIDGGDHAAYFRVANTDTADEVYFVEFGWLEQGRLSKARYRVHVGSSEVSDDTIASIDSKVDTIDTVVDGIQTDLSNGTDGLGALKAAIDTVDTVVDGIQTDLDNGTDGLGALKTLVDAVDVVADAILVDTGTTLPATLSTMEGKIDTVDTVADGIQTDLSNSTDGLGALKALIDTVDTVADGIQTDLSNGTDGLGALKAAIDTVDTVADGIQTDLGNGTDGLGALKSLIDSVQTTVDGIQNNTRLSVSIPSKLNRPETGADAIEMSAYVYDSAGAMEDPDNSEVMVRLKQSSGSVITDRFFTTSGIDTALSNATNTTDFSSAAGWRAMERTAAGRYFFFYESNSADSEESLQMEFGWEEAGVDVFQSRPLTISDAADLDTIDSNVDAILVDTGTTLPSTLSTMEGKIDTVDTVVDGIQTDLSNGTDGLGALKALIDTVDTVADGIQTDLSNGTDGLGALKTLVDAVDVVADAILVDTGTTLPATLSTMEGKIDTVDTVVDGIQTDLSNSTDGLGALKTLIDAVDATVEGIQTDLDNGTDGLGALKTLVDTVDTVVDTISAEVGTISGVHGTLSAISGQPNDAAVNPATDAGSMFAWLKHIENHVSALDAATGIQAGTVTLYPLNDPTALLSTDPTEHTDSSGAQEASSTASEYTAIASYQLTFSEPVAATLEIMNMFATLKWDMQGAGSGPKTGGVKWFLVPGGQTVAENSSSTATNGTEITGLTGEFALTADIPYTSNLNSHLISGLVPSNGLANMIGSDGTDLNFKLVLAANSDTADDTVTCTVYDSSSLELTYSRI